MTPSLQSLAFDISPYAQMIVDPYNNELLAVNAEATRLLDFPDNASLMRIRPSDLFHSQLAEWTSFTEEAIANSAAWSDALSIHANNNQQIALEVAAKVQHQEERYAVLLCFQSAKVARWWRDKGEAQYHYRSGIGHWDRVAKVFREFEYENQLILDAAGEGIYGLDKDGNTTFVNAAAEQMLGWTKPELFGRNIHDIIHHTHPNGEHFHNHECSIFQAIRDGIQRNVEGEVFWKKSGEPMDVEYTSTPIKDNGHIIGAVVIFRDVTQKRIDQQRLLDALSEVERLKNRLEMENAYLQEEISHEFNHHHIVGKSGAINHILEKIEMVGPTDVSVMISGESGTGKELIARAIHEVSERRSRSLIRVNCAAIPAELFESEFFGHRKGAFTGATDNRVGRFELADGGTLFLDEVGEIPLPLQGKLLRVLQEQTFERVGESKTREVDVRIIAATNKNLRELVEQGQFREDLFFRLNVFPIESVPLRERRDDIPLLAAHFLKRASTKANKTNLKIPLTQIERLQMYSWPGNIRELENVIERQVILARRDTLSFDDLPVEQLGHQKDQNENIKGLYTDLDLKQREKMSIENALKKCGGKVSGSQGAAQLLNVKPTTLASRIKKHGIDIRSYKKGMAKSA